MVDHARDCTVKWRRRREGGAVNFDVLVLGSGPAGYYCALNCARRGKKTLLVEKEHLGGTGFRWGCLPVKMMLDRIRAQAGGNSAEAKSSVIAHTAERIEEVEARIERRLSGSGVTLIKGRGRFVGPGSFRVGKRSISASHMVIATGTEPAGWPGVPLDGKSIISHKDVLSLSRVPEHLLILGGDVEGIEFACLFSHLGTRVTVVEKEATILPGTDRDLVEPLEARLIARGVRLITGAVVRSCSTNEAAVRVDLDNGSQLSGDMVLVTGLRRANLPEGLEEAGVDHDGQKIRVNGDLQTSCGSIYAAGDINGISGMAHAAIQQALLVAQRITEGAVRGFTEGAVRGITNPPYPRAIYTLPEIAGAGYQETELNAAGIPYKCRRYRIGDTWRGFSKGIDEGFVKILSGQDDRILGIWMCGGDVSELASLFGALLSKNLTVGELLHSLILHPTLGEALLEAAMELE
jgi:dihydrolipoamide dehydrogenase